MGVNRVILVGRLGQDPEVKMTSDQRQIVNFSLATGERRKDANGNWTEHTEWHRIVCFGKLAEIVSQYLKKGREVYIEGRIRTNKWQDKDGNARYTTEIIADKLEFVGGKAEGSSSNYDSGASAQDIGNIMSSLKSADSVSAPQSVPFEDDDIPF